MVSFEVTKDERKLIEKIAERADKDLFGHAHGVQSRLDTEMDLSAVIAQGVPMRLQELLDADAFNFAHDIGGIYRHLDRSTGKLGGCFLPRFALTAAGAV